MTKTHDILHRRSLTDERHSGTGEVMMSEAEEASSVHVAAKAAAPVQMLIRYSRSAAQRAHTMHEKS